MEFGDFFVALKILGILRSKDRWFEEGALPLLLQFFEGNMVSLSSLFLSLEFKSSEE